MGKETVNGVTNYYGPRHKHEGVAGQLPSAGMEKEMVIHLSGDTYLTVEGTLPAGAVVSGPAIVEVTEVFALGGTSPVINVGVSGSEGTNRVAQVSEAQAEAVGTYAIATAGTLAVDTPLAAAATIKVALGGTSPTITGSGRMKVVVPYRVI